MYLVYLTTTGGAFYTQWFGDDLVPNEPYVCFDLENNKFTMDNVEWENITEDHL